MNGIEEGVVDYAVYEDGNRYLGIADVELPTLNNKQFNISGAGLAGEMDLPVVGHRDAMKVKIKFRDASEAAYILSETRVHLIDLRVVKQGLDYTAGEIITTNHKYVVKIVPLSRTGGVLKPATPQSVDGEYSCLYLAEYIDGKCVSKIDPIGYVDIDHTGKDRAEQIRRGLGMI